jgi:dimethylglycine dehydrogenase
MPGPGPTDGTPGRFGHELLPKRTSSASASRWSSPSKRYPVLAEAGIKQVINGPFTFAPDGNPLMGPVPGLRNYWCACAVMAGFSQGGRSRPVAGRVDGSRASRRATCSPWTWPASATPARRPTPASRCARTTSAVSPCPIPNEELPAGRPLHTTPAYGMWKARRAVFGQGYGLEHVNYFAREGEPLFETPTFRRSNAFEAVGEECRAVREAVGINEMHNFGKYEVTGPGAARWLDWIMAGSVPTVGRISLAPMLSPAGRIIGDFTLSRLDEDTFQVTASYGAQGYHLRWFEQHLPADGSVAVRNRSLQWLGFQIAGPEARTLLQRVTSADVSNHALPFMSVRDLDAGLCDARVQRVTYTGDLGYEIYVPAEQQLMLYRALAEAGTDLGLRPFGMRAMMSLRLEKSFGSWLREFRPDFVPAETLLNRFVAYDKDADFIGREAARAAREREKPRSQQVFVVEANDADAFGDEPIWHDGQVVGFVTSGGYAHHVGESVAIGMLPANLAVPDLDVSIEILGEMRPARMIGAPLFDPDAKRMRG